VQFEDPADRTKFALKPELSAEYQAKLGNFEGKVVKFATKVLGADKDKPKEEISQNLRMMNETVPLRGSHFHTLSNKIARELRTDQSRLSDIEKSSKGTKENPVNVDHSLVEKFNLALNEIAGFPEPTPSDQECSMSSDSMSAGQNQDDGIASALQLDANFSVGRSAGFRSVNLENKLRRRFDGSLSPMDKLISKIIEENEEDDFGSTCAKKFGHSLPKIDMGQLSGVSIGIMKVNSSRVNSSRVISSKFNTERGASRRVSETNLRLSPRKKKPKKLSHNHMKSLDNLSSTRQILKKKIHDKLQHNSYTFAITKVINDAALSLKQKKESRSPTRNYSAEKTGNDLLFDRLIKNSTNEKNKSRLTVETIEAMKEKFSQCLEKVRHRKSSFQTNPQKPKTLKFEDQAPKKNVFHNSNRDNALDSHYGSGRLGVEGALQVVMENSPEDRLGLNSMSYSSQGELERYQQDLRENDVCCRFGISE
jgi:hypothetical protein